MQEQDYKSEKFYKKMSRVMHVTLFLTYFCRFFFPLFVLGTGFVIAGFFKTECFYIGGIILVIDALLSLTLMLRMLKIQSDHPEFERFRQAMSGGDAYRELNELTDEWTTGEGFYSKRVDVLKKEAEECKTVRDAYELYKKHCEAIVIPSEEYRVTIGPERKYFADGEKYFVISFDRMREILDDVECHFYYDLLYDPSKKGCLHKTSFSTCDFESRYEFFDAVEEYLVKNDLMDLPIDKTNIGTDED